MAINLRGSKAEALARDITARTGESMTQAIVVALEDRLARLRAERSVTVGRAQDILAAARRINRRKTRDTRATDAILGYDKHGLPR